MSPCTALKSRATRFLKTRASNLLSVNADAKTRKGLKLGHLTGVLYLAAADSSGVYNVCAKSKNCKAPCLNWSGRSRIFAAIQNARVERTFDLFEDRAAFVARLEAAIAALVRKAARENLIPCVRLNGTSDLPWLSLLLASKYPEIQFYDYTKLDRAWERVRSNYHLTFSWDGENWDECERALEHGLNVAVPFDLKRGEALPAEWRGYRVIDGDVSDLRFLDDRQVVVGLRVKSVSPERKESGLNSGFIVSILPVAA